MNSVNELLERKKNRALAIILSTKERECDYLLDEQSSYKLRKVILDQVNEFYEYTADIIEALTSGTEIAVNEYWLERMADKER
jgi:hypothetical protein